MNESLSPALPPFFPSLLRAALHLTLPFKPFFFLEYEFHLFVSVSHLEKSKSSLERISSSLLSYLSKHGEIKRTSFRLLGNEWKIQRVPCTFSPYASLPPASASCSRLARLLWVHEPALLLKVHCLHCRFLACGNMHLLTLSYKSFTTSQIFLCSI